MFCVQFYSLSGKFTTERTEVFETFKAAREAAFAHALAGGYTNPKIRDSQEPDDGILIVAKTPGGRSGRNVAAIDLY